MIQFTIRMDDDVYKEAEAIAIKDDRPMNQVLCLLLKQALKERIRKKRGAKENNTSDLPPNLSEGHSGG